MYDVSSRAENNDALAACIQNLANLSSSKPNPKTMAGRYERDVS